MTITPANLRSNFPEFSSVIKYPTDCIQFWLDFAYSMLNSHRWGDQLDMAAQLYAAHQMVLERRALDESKVGGTPGQSTGVISGKSANGISVSFDTSTASETRAGHWNLTVYGIRLYRLIKIFGMGPAYVGGANFSPLFNSGAWDGPPLWPGWYGST